MPTYQAFASYPATGPQTSPRRELPLVAAGGKLRITLTGTSFVVRVQISNAKNTTGPEHLFIPPDSSFETAATLSAGDMPYTLPGPVRWIRLILDSGTVDGGQIEEDETRTPGNLALASQTKGILTPEQFGNDLLATSNALQNGNQLRLTDTYSAPAYAVDTEDGSRYYNNGIYWQSPGALRPKANTTVDLLGATIALNATNQTNYSILTIYNQDHVTVRGGTLKGDRDTHDYSSGGSHEWGYGIFIRGDTKNVLVEDLTVSDLTGDGIYIGTERKQSTDTASFKRPSNITIRNVNSLRNRRQGMSVISVKYLRIDSCDFSDTGITQNGIAGTPPMAGIDLEPNLVGELIEDVEIVGSRLRNNFAGLETAGPFGQIKRVRMINCILEGNAYALLILRGAELELVNCIIRDTYGANHTGTPAPVYVESGTFRMIGGRIENSTNCSRVMQLGSSLDSSIPGPDAYLENVLFTGNPEAVPVIAQYRGKLTLNNVKIDRPGAYGVDVFSSDDYGFTMIGGRISGGVSAGAGIHIRPGVTHAAIVGVTIEEGSDRTLVAGIYNQGTNTKILFNDLSRGPSGTRLANQITDTGTGTQREGNILRTGTETSAVEFTTQATSDNSTKPATTAWVKNQGYLSASGTPIFTGPMTLSSLGSSAQATSNLLVARTPDLNGVIFGDYQDEFALFHLETGRTASYTANVTASSGAIGNVFLSDTSTLAWSSGTNPFPIVLTMDSTSATIAPSGNATFRLGLTFRGSGVPTGVLVEMYDSTAGAWSTVLNDAAPVISSGFYLSGVIASPNAGAVVQTRVTLTGTNPLASSLNIQRVILYHSTGRWDRRFLRRDGDTILGTVNVVGGSLQVSGVNVQAAYTGSLTYDFPSIAASSAATTTLTVTGAALGNTVTVASGTPSIEASGIQLRAWVSATNTVTIEAYNRTAAAVDPVNATYFVRVLK